MTTRPTRIAQTSTEVKKLHKRNGPVLPERQLRQLERDAELEERAQRLRDAEKRRKLAVKKREERERREREARRQAGVGLATQLVGYSHTQAKLKSGMEAFLGYKKRREEEKRKEIELSKQLEAMVEDEMRKEPWDDDEEAFDLPDPKTLSGEQWNDDELDDDTLLEAHDLVMSDPVEEPTGVEPIVFAPIPEAPACSPSKDSADFVRLHGPINKSIESILDQLPDPLIELLSQDSSTNPVQWAPAPSLLHKLNPPGLPPHRLRIKVGCVVTLLRDLNTSSQLSRSQHLRIVRKEMERLECLVLDGHLQGTKTVLTRISFLANHRNDSNCSYQRLQFPIQVAKDWVPTVSEKERTRSTFKLPSIVGQSPRPESIPRKSTPQLTPRPSLNANPSFKLPGLPASKAQSSLSTKPLDPPSTALLDGWDDFLDSGTQIARELSSEPSSPVRSMPTIGPAPPAPVKDTLPALSAQDFDFSLDDLDEEPLPVKSATGPSKRPTATIMPPPPKVIPRKPLEQSTNTAGSPLKMPLLLPSHAPHLKPVRKSPFPRTDHPLTSRHKAVAPAVPAPPPVPKRKSMDASAASRAPQPKRVSSPRRSHSATSHVQPGMAKAAPAPAPRAGFQPLQSFGDFGLSTQEVASFFDDEEEVAFGSPPIAV